MYAATHQNAIRKNQQLQQHHQQQPQKQQSLAASATQQPTSTSSSSEQEEALKRNTDCVYFLASPLTCKKGSDCEYRHSDFARVNPRDCWFWLNGNCLNPKCGFRHPPLDGLLGGQAATVSGPPVPTSQKIRTPGTHASYGPKPVPCVFFQQGQCLKGDMCLFLHGPNPTTSSKAPQVQGTKQYCEPPKPTKAFGSLEKCSQEKRIPQTNVNKLLTDGYVAKPVRKVGTTAKTNSSSGSIVPPPTSFNFDASRAKATSISPTANGISSGRLNHPHQFHASDDHNLQNGKDSEEFLRESSPGFDVLVDDDLRASDDYYHDEDHFGRDNNLGSMAEYDRQSTDYNSLNDIHGQGRFHDSQTYTSYGHMQEPYHPNMPSSERIKGGPDHLERRGYGKAGSPENTVSDLRYRLSKQRRVEGLKSVVSHNVSLDDHYDERSFRSSSRKDLTRQPLKESSLSNRLRGRIKLAEGSQSSSYQGRLRDRINGRGSMDYDDGKNLRIRQMRRDVNAGSSGFAGPKSLAELRAVKTTENKEQYLLRKRKFEDDHISNDISFEGPKPLSEILKEKRGATAASGTISSSNNNKNNNIYETGETKTSGLDNRAAVGTQSSFPSLGKDDPRKNASEGVDKSNLIPGQSSEEPLPNKHEAEEGMIYDETLEGQENEGDEPREGEYDDQVYEEDYVYHGVEHAGQENEGGEAREGEYDDQVYEEDYVYHGDEHAGQENVGDGDEQRDGEYDNQVYEEDYVYDGDDHANQEEYLDEDGDDFA